MKRPLAEAAAAMGGRVVRGDGEARFDGASFDSREITGGELFFALPGEQSDGHRWVSAALEAGAAAAVVHEDVELSDDVGTEAVPADAGLIRVDDTYRALHALVDHYRDEGMPPRLVSITGSAGKTTTKELLAAILGRSRRVAKNEGNLNNLYGYPLSVLRMPEDSEWMVAEMGMSSAGELSQLSRLGRPDVVVYTCVKPVHLEFFDSVEGIAAAKAELLEAIAPDGRVVANAADAPVRRFVQAWADGPGSADRVTWYGLDAGGGEREGGGSGPGGRGAHAPHVTARDVTASDDGRPGSRFTIDVHGVPGKGREASFEVRLGLHGEYNVDNALAAAATALSLGVSPADVAAGLAAARPAAGRGIVHDLPGGGLLIDDTYNSNPDALERALRSAADLAADRGGDGGGDEGAALWAVLGDMLELGPEAPRFHREAGRTAAELGFSPVAGVGELSRELAEAAAEAGAEAPWFEDAEAAAEWAADRLAAGDEGGDVILVKASRGIGLDAVVQRLLAAAGDSGADDEGSGEAA